MLSSVVLLLDITLSQISRDSSMLVLYACFSSVIRYCTRSASNYTRPEGLILSTVSTRQRLRDIYI